jgi:hypothetical protein
MAYQVNVLLGFIEELQGVRVQIQLFDVLEASRRPKSVPRVRHRCPPIVWHYWRVRTKVPWFKLAVSKVTAVAVSVDALVPVPLKVSVNATVGSVSSAFH